MGSEMCIRDRSCGVEMRLNEIIGQGSYFINFNNTKKNATLVGINEDL